MMGKDNRGGFRGEKICAGFSVDLGGCDGERVWEQRNK